MRSSEIEFDSSPDYGGHTARYPKKIVDARMMSKRVNMHFGVETNVAWTRIGNGLTLTGFVSSILPA
jgi:hypothetical protein